MRHLLHCPLDDRCDPAVASVISVRTTKFSSACVERFRHGTREWATPPFSTMNGQECVV
jgi:hypothetical protein